MDYLETKGTSVAETPATDQRYQAHLEDKMLDTVTLSRRAGEDAIGVVGYTPEEPGLCLDGVSPHTVLYIRRIGESLHLLTGQEQQQWFPSRCRTYNSCAQDPRDLGLG